MKLLQWSVANGNDTRISIIRSVRHGHLEILQWIASLGKLNMNICIHAACYGQLEVLKWIRNPGQGQAPICSIDEQTWFQAAERGHLHILKWLHDNEQNPGRNQSYICSRAVLGQHLEVLKWARSVGYAWDWRCIHYAVMNGPPEILQWLRQNGAPE